jgi:hypothetical protein
VYAKYCTLRETSTAFEAQRKVSFLHCLYIYMLPVFQIAYCCQSQWQCSPSRGSAAARLLGLQVQSSLEAWMSVSCEGCELSGKGLCIGLIAHPEESCQAWCVELSVNVKP